MKARVLVRGLVTLASLAAVGLLIEQTDLGSALNTEWMDVHVRGRGLTGGALFVGAAALFIAVGLPRQVMCFLGGYAFGLIEGSAWSLLASVLGGAAAFYYARLLGRDLIRVRFSQKARRIDDFLHEHPFSMALLIRLLPVGSNLVTNLAAGVSSTSAFGFLAGSALGYVPQTVIFALVGSGIGIDPQLRIGLGAVLFVASGALGLHLYRKHRHGHKLDDEIEAAIAEDDEAKNEAKAR